MPKGQQVRLSGQTAGQKASTQRAKARIWAGRKPKVIPPTSSWWLGLDAQAFYQHLAKGEKNDDLARVDRPAASNRR